MVFTVDIEKMYWQIRVHIPRTQDCNAYSGEFSQITSIQIYELHAVTYGTLSAPCLTTSCLKKLVEDERDEYPQATTVLSLDFFMTDVFSGCDDVTEVLKFKPD
jgi:hypothetical protein